MFQSKRQEILSRIVFVIYLVLLTWLVLFKFATNLSDLPNMRGINLIPFYYDQQTNMHLKEIFYNIVVFVPFGVYLQIFQQNCKMIYKCIIILFTSFVFEVMQFVFAIGASDITDILVNTVGGIIGIAFCIAMKKIIPNKFLSIINILGLLIEASAIGLMVLLLAANA